jgi:aminocarboxymuconate-semialdehyde decarboxylase
MIVDVHAHALTREFLAELARENAFGIEVKGDGFGFGGYGSLDPMLSDVEGAVRSLTARDITLQLVSPPPRIVSHAGWGADRAFARRLNRQTADFVRQAGNRHGGLAVPALTEPEHAVAEIRRALDEDGLTGVALPTSAAGRPLDDPAFEPLFAECARRGVIVFMHPTTGVERPAFGQYTMLQLVGWPSETGLCVARLIFAGVFERHPGLKLVLAHGGGTLAMLAGRLDLAYEAPHYEANADCRKNISRLPSSYLKQIFLRHRRGPSVSAAVSDRFGGSRADRVRLRFSVRDRRPRRRQGAACDCRTARPHRCRHSLQQRRKNSVERKVGA